MLRELRIKSFTIIDLLTINFESGLNILTGETGTGKSAVVGAVGLLLGNKAPQDMIKAGEKEAYIEAYFDNTDIPMLKELSIENDEGIVIRRSISSQGKGRAYINDTPVNIQTLSNVSKTLIDIHGQHEHQGLLKKDSHLLFLDSFGGLTEDISSLQSLHSKVVSIKNKVAELKERIYDRRQRIEFLKFQINEIDSACLKHGEKKAVEEERAILLNLSKLKESSEVAYSLLYGSEGSCLERLSAVASQIRDMAQIDHSAKEILDILEQAIPSISDASILLRNIRDKYELDPQRLIQLDERFELIKRLEKKYGTKAKEYKNDENDINEILKYRDNAKEDLKNLEHIDEQYDVLEAELNLKSRELKLMAEGLSEKRRSTSAIMEKMIINELHEVGFQKAEFKVDMRKRDEVTANGIDDVEFLFSANPGEPLKPLIKVASGGELSRIMLALKCIEISQESKKDKSSELITHNSELRTLIFDEVDAGIGGVTARHVGKRLKAISGVFQVLCITHLPQVAAQANYHLSIEKKLDKNRVEVVVRPLANLERQREIARMLSGKITDSSIKHARELLELTK